MARPAKADGADARKVLIASCDAAAAKAASCVISQLEADAAVRALVFWRGPTLIRVEVGLASRKGPWAIRELEFSARDPALEKWRTVGYTVGSLASEALAAKEHPGEVENVGAVEEGPAPGSPSASSGTPPVAQPPNPAEVAKPAQASKPPQADKPVENEKPPEPAAPPRAGQSAAEAKAASTADGGTSADATSPSLGAERWAFTAGGLLGPGLGSVRGGGLVRASRVFRGPYATVAFAYSVDAADSRGVSADRIALSAGGGYEWTLGFGLGVGVRGEVVAEQLAAHVDDPSSGRRDGQSRWVSALDLGAELVYRVTGPVAVVGGADATVRTNRTDIQVHGAPVATAATMDAVAFLGARVLLR